MRRITLKSPTAPFTFSKDDIIIIIIIIIVIITIIIKDIHLSIYLGEYYFY